MLNTFKTLSVLAVCGLTVGCSVKKQLDEMHDATVKMAEKMPQMADNTTAMRAQTNDMYEQLCNAYLDGRQGATRDIRSKALDMMDATDDIEEKLSHATAYYYAFEVQLYKNDTNDNPAKYNDLMKQMMDEYVHVIHRYRDRNDSISPTSKGNTRMGLYALAAAMHRSNPQQNAIAKERGLLNPENMLNFIMEALKERRNVELGRKRVANLPEWQQTVLRYEDLMFFLLKIRANFLAASPLASISDLNDSDRGFWSTIGLTGFVDLLSGGWKTLFDWKANYQIPLAALDYQTLKMTKALETREYLARAGIDFTPDSTVLSIYKNMREKDKEDEEEQPGRERQLFNDAQLVTITDFRGAVDAWINFPNAR